MADSTKLARLADVEGLTVSSMLQQYADDSVVPGICMGRFCDWTTYVEPDCTDGLCVECGMQTVQSCMLLAGVI